MRIVFNLVGVGLGNNGGSRTIVKCAEILAQLGNEVILLSNTKSKFTWFKTDKIKFILGSVQPSCNIAIATGFQSARHVFRSHADKKFYYIRGFELWNASEADLFRSYQSLRCIVNSEWLKKKLASRAIFSHIVYPGLDFDIYYNKNIQRNIDIGSLYHSRHKTKKSEHAQHVASLISTKLLMLNKDIKNPSEPTLCDWYNPIKVWFAPTELEGLHNPPMEASLCGCGFVCTDHERSGMSDYAIHNETALVYKAGDLSQAAVYTKKLLEDESVRTNLNNNMTKLLRTKIGDRKRNMEKMLSIFREN